MKRTAALVLVSMLASAGVVILMHASAGAQPAPEAQPGEEAEPQLSEAEEARRGRVYAKVGDTNITVGEIEDAINAQSPFLRARYRDPSKLQEFAANMVRFELLAQAAASGEYGQNAAVVRSTKQNSVQQLIRREFDERITPESIPAADIEAYYAEHTAEFSRPEMLRASHILLASEEEATTLLEQVQGADARTFRQLARQHSIDTETKLRGGDLRYFAQDGRPSGGRDAAVDEHIVAAAFALEDVGDVVSAPVAAGTNWSIVKLTGRRPAESRSIEDAGQGIRLRLWRERRQGAIEDFVTGLRERANPEVQDERMRAIRLDPMDPTDGFPAHGREEEEGPTKARPGASGATPAAPAGEAPEAPAAGE